MLKSATFRIVLVSVAVLLMVGISTILLAVLSGDDSASCVEYYAGMENPPIEAQDWCNAGKYFSWESTMPVNEDFDDLHIFHVCQGQPEDPAILLIHGYPTSSFDFAALMEELSNNYYVCALDTPGYGFSDKPLDGYDYAIPDDAQLVDYYIRNVLALDDFALLTHDKGDSVGFALLQIYQAYETPPYTINHHFITNGNIYLPLAQLTNAQNALLNPISGPIVSSIISGDRFAQGLADETFAITLPQSEIDAYASIFDYQDGLAVQHEIIKYLNERSGNEVIWLETLGRSDIPTTMIWGELDAIAPVAVPDHAWTNYLEKRETPAAYWRIACANHYLQVDVPGLIAEIVRTSLTDNLGNADWNRAIIEMECES